MLINEKIKGIWHGADYNPDQWTDYPQALEKDIELMKKAGCNVMALGIFAWAKLEPQEGIFDFTWLDERIENLYKNGIYTILATPSGAMPSWMAEKYPEVRRMAEDGIRYRFGNRHNNCYSSTVYMEKVRIINRKLAERYSNHPGVIMWHISNEYNIGDCHCPLCRDNFRKWLKNEYKTIENLNKKWWNGFWSHTYSDFSQIEPPGDHGEIASNPLKLSWHRFKNHMLRNFIKNEVEAVKGVNPNIPVTTNYMGCWDMDYAKLSEYVDFVSWDNYPEWHKYDNEQKTASDVALYHSLFKSMKKDRPFMLMESSPSATNWQDVSKLRHPGMHLLASMQAVAHGSDTVQYFQWRKSRGQAEQFHGAVVGHDGSDDTRIFKEVAKVGENLKKIEEIAGTLTKNDVAILYDYDSFWSLRLAQAYRNQDCDKGYIDILSKNHRALWQLNIGCDFVFENDDFSEYKAIVAPMLFMLKAGMREKIENYVKAGGIFVTTFGSGIVDENGLSFFGKECYPFRNLLAVKAEETDSLYDGQYNYVNMFGKTYKSEKYCELAYPEGAKVIGTYEKDFYSGMPAVTVNEYGKGRAYYIATDLTLDGYVRLYEEWFGHLFHINTPENVSIKMRYSTSDTYAFLMNFNNEVKEVNLPFEYEVICGDLSDKKIQPYGVAVCKKIIR